MTRPEVPADALYGAIIGQSNQDYYLSYFHRADTRGYAPISWHWPVLFVGLFWLVYRKQYRFALIAFVYPYLATIAATALNIAIDGAGEPLLVIALVGFGAIWLPLNANAIYYRWARSQIVQAQQTRPGQQAAQVELLSERGGTHRQFPLIVLGAAVLVSILIGTLPPAP